MSLSPTLAISQEISRRRAQGLPVVALGFGEASIPVHPLLVERLALHATEGGYGPVAGTGDLLAAAAGYWSRRGIATQPGDVVAGPGSKSLLYAVFEALGGPVLLPRPSWVSYAAQNRILDQQVVMVPTSREGGGVPDPREVDRVAQSLQRRGSPAKAVLVTVPDNPTGTVATPEVVTQLCHVAERHNLVIVSDEIYLDLVHDDAQDVRTPSQVLPERTITTTGLSKSLAVGGWRIGVARFPATPALTRVRDRVTSVASELWSAPAHPVQLAAAWAFAEPEPLHTRTVASRRLHGRVARAVAAIFRDGGAQVDEPTGGFYIYPDFAPTNAELAAQGITSGSRLAEVLLDTHGIAALPGVAFGDHDDRLALRVATPMLYGTTDEQRLAALDADAPETLPWIGQSLEALRVALTALRAGSRASEPRRL